MLASADTVTVPTAPVAVSPVTATFGESTTSTVDPLPTAVVAAFPISPIFASLVTPTLPTAPVAERPVTTAICSSSSPNGVEPNAEKPNIS